MEEGLSCRGAYVKEEKKARIWRKRLSPHWADIFFPASYRTKEGIYFHIPWSRALRVLYVRASRHPTHLPTQYVHDQAKQNALSWWDPGHWTKTAKALSCFELFLNQGPIRLQGFFTMVSRCNSALFLLDEIHRFGSSFSSCISQPGGLLFLSWYLVDTKKNG